MGMLVNPYVFGGGGPPPGSGGGAWAVIAALTAPSSGKLTFGSLDLSPYDYVELVIAGVTTATASTHIRLVLKVGAGPSVATHTWGGRSHSSSNTTNDSSGAAAANAELTTNGSSAFPLGNTAGDAFGAVVTIDAPGDTGLKKTISARETHGYDGSDNISGGETAASIVETGAITEIVVEGSANFTAGRAMLIGHTKS